MDSRRFSQFLFAIERHAEQTEYFGISGMKFQLRAKGCFGGREILAQQSRVGIFERFGSLSSQGHGKQREKRQSHSQVDIS